MKRDLKINLLVTVIAVLLTAGLTILLQNSGPPAINTAPNIAPHERSGQPAPASVLQLHDGGTKNLHDYKGRVVILNFWATWCVPCAVEYPQMLRLAAAMPDTLTILAVSVDEDSAALDRFLARYGTRPANFVIARDPERKIAQGQYQTVQYPESYLIDSRMILRDKVIGTPPYEWDDAQMQARLDALR